VAAGQIVGGELRRHPAPADSEAGAEHRQLRARVSERAQHVRREAGNSQADEHERDRQLLGGVAGGAWRCEQRGSDHAEHDRAHGEVLVASRFLAQHPLGEQHQHEQSRGQRRLHHSQRCEQQRHHLQRPADDRQSSADQPACSPDQTPGERQTQVLLVRGLLGIGRLQRDP